MATLWTPLLHVAIVRILTRCLQVHLTKIDKTGSGIQIAALDQFYGSTGLGIKYSTPATGVMKQ